MRVPQPGLGRQGGHQRVVGARAPGARGPGSRGSAACVVIRVGLGYGLVAPAGSPASSLWLASSSSLVQRVCSALDQDHECCTPPASHWRCSSARQRTFKAWPRRAWACAGVQVGAERRVPADRLVHGARREELPAAAPAHHGLRAAVPPGAWDTPTIPSSIVPAQVRRPSGARGAPGAPAIMLFCKGTASGALCEA